MEADQSLKGVQVAAPQEAGRSKRSRSDADDSILQQILQHMVNLEAEQKMMQAEQRAEQKAMQAEQRAEQKAMQSIIEEKLSKLEAEQKSIRSALDRRLFGRSLHMSTAGDDDMRNIRVKSRSLLPAVELPDIGRFDAVFSFNSEKHEYDPANYGAFFQLLQEFCQEKFPWLIPLDIRNTMKLVLPRSELVRDHWSGQSDVCFFPNVPTPVATPTLIAGLVNFKKPNPSDHLEWSRIARLHAMAAHASSELPSFAAVTDGRVGFFAYVANDTLYSQFMYFQDILKHILRHVQQNSPPSPSFLIDASAVVSGTAYYWFSSAQKSCPKLLFGETVGLGRL